MIDETSRVQTIGRYHVLEEIGRGAMAVVYKGFDPVIGRAVALKTIAFGTADAEVTDLRQRLYREACAAGTLAHPNIVTIFDVIEQEGVTAVAMELVEGQTLAALIAERAPLPLDAALEIFEQIAAALDYAGGRGIIHRDIKPANILMTSDGRAKVADFGVARMALSSMTQTGTVVGSPSYMSPEQVRGQTLDPRSDLFSGAVVLYELLTRERPFSGDDVATTMYRIVHEAPTPPSEFNSALGPQIADVFAKALAKEPDRRYRSGAELCVALRQAVGANVLAPAAASAAVAAPAVPRKSRRLWVAVGLGALPIVLLLALIAVGGRSPARSREAGRAQPPPAAAEGLAPPAQPERVPPALPPETPAPTGSLAGPVSTVPAAAAPVRGPVSTVPAAAGTKRPEVSPAPSRAARVGRESPAAGGSETAAREEVSRPSARVPAAEPAPPAAAPPQGPASLQVSYDGAAYPVTLIADGQQIGRVENSDQHVTVDAGRLTLRAVNDSVFLDQALGTITLRPEEKRVLTLPGAASVFIGVQGNSYAGLQITIDGRSLGGPYPAQIPRIAATSHRIVFRWTDGALRGVEVSDTVDLSGGRQFSIRAVPENGQIAVQRIR
jgi:tRNA A-37 threonylcarbamoyl transferase component Bud32